MYSTIVKKKGYCNECPPEQGEQDLTNGKCHNHYWQAVRLKSVQKRQARYKVSSLINTDENVEIAIRNSELKEWFLYHIKYAAKRCDNCGASIAHYNLKYLRGSQHHIIEKHLCPSVASELLNHVVLGFFCCHQQAHTSYMNVVKMPVFRLMKERFELFKDKIADEERKNVPECFLMPIKQAVSSERPND